jgi:hypothetical protein
MLLLDRADFDYVPFYCEENVWRLLARKELTGLPAWAVLVASPARDVVLMRQRSGRTLDGLVHWDYHVFALVDDRTEGLAVLDLDTDLSFPCPASRYVDDTFSRAELPARSVPYFRLIESAEYRVSFASDRTHMRKPDGSWIAPPPPWPCLGEGRPNVLQAWTDMGRRTPGRVLDVHELVALAMDEERRARRLKDAH